VTRRDIVERLRTLRVMMEQRGGVLLSEVKVPASLVFFDVMSVLGLSTEAQVYVLGVDNALRLREEYGIEWEDM